MSINLRVTKIIAVLSFLLISGVQENGVPNLALLLIYFYQFLSGLSSNVSSIFWEGLVIIPVLGLLILFVVSRNYSVLLSCFVVLLAFAVYITGLMNNYHRINIAFIIPLVLFLTSSIYAIAVAKKTTA